MTNRDLTRRLERLEDEAEGATGDDPPEMLTSPLVADEDDVAPWYWTPEDGGTIFTPDQVDPDEHFICAMEWSIIESAEWYDSEKFPDDHDEVDE